MADDQELKIFCVVLHIVYGLFNTNYDNKIDLLRLKYKLLSNVFM
jgi:hypothetical protein